MCARASVFVSVHIPFWLDAYRRLLIECVIWDRLPSQLNLDRFFFFFPCLKYYKLFLPLFLFFSFPFLLFFSSSFFSQGSTSWCVSAILWSEDLTINAILYSFAKRTCCDCWFVELFQHREQNIHCSDTYARQLKAIHFPEVDMGYTHVLYSTEPTAKT